MNKLENNVRNIVRLQIRLVPKQSMSCKHFLGKKV
jgi:hypothetical protein